MPQSKEDNLSHHLKCEALLSTRFRGIFYLLTGFAVDLQAQMFVSFGLAMITGKVAMMVARSLLMRLLSPQGAYLAAGSDHSGGCLASISLAFETCSKILPPHFGVLTSTRHPGTLFTEINTLCMLLGRAEERRFLSYWQSSNGQLTLKL